MSSSVIFECEDIYEAEKLAGLLHVQKNGNTLIGSTSAVVNAEVILLLKDKSAHSVVLKDSNTALRLKTLVEEIVNKKKSIIETKLHNSMLEIITSEH